MMKEVKVFLLLGTCVKCSVKLYVRVIKIILFYKVKERVRVKEGEWTVGAVCASVR